MISVVAVLWALFGVLALTGLIGFPIWLVCRAVAALRRRVVVPWALRVGDRERAAVARRFGDDYAEGRLSLDELEVRSERAWRAATYADLRAIAVDLPPARPLRAFRPLDLALAFAAGAALVG